MSEKLAPALQSIANVKDRFKTIAKHTGVHWDQESMYAMQQIQKNDYIFGIANRAPASVRDAVINVASIGLSLNPAHGYAYLVPRNSIICLDVSYKGLIKIATDTGSVRWAKAELVYANDLFTYKGVSQPPVHESNPFGDRGEMVGCYCIAKTSDGDYLVETMSKDELYEIRNRSEAYKSFANGKSKQCPWVDFEGEMCKKTVIKRASKTWPKTMRGDMLQNAIGIINEHEGIDFSDSSVVEHKSREQIEKEQYDALCDMYTDSIVAIKDAIRENDVDSAVSAYFDIPPEAAEALWKAPSKGGIFTTAERAFIKSNEFSAARQRHFGSASE